MLRGVLLDRFDADRLRTRTRLSRADVDRGTGAVSGSNAIVEVRAEETPSHVRVTITSPRAEADLAERGFTMLGGVRMVDDEGRTMTTERIDYDAKADRIASNDDVEVRGSNFVVRGKKLEGQPRAGQLRLVGPVSSEVTSHRDAP